MAGDHNPLIAYGGWLANTPDVGRGGAGRGAQTPSSIRSRVDPGGPRRHAKGLRDRPALGEGPCTAIGAQCGWPPVGRAGQWHRRPRARLRRQLRPAQGARQRGVVPAILALAEQENASGRGCLDAFIAAYRLWAASARGEPCAPQPRLARHLNVGDRRRGGLARLRALPNARRLTRCQSRPAWRAGSWRSSHDDQAAPRRPRRQGRSHGR